MGAQLLGFGVISLCVTCLWILSVMLHDTSIIDGFWGTGFVVLTWLYYFHPDTEGGDTNRKLLISLMISLWGLRLSLYLIWRNWGKGEDARYQRLRTKIGANYWWLSWILVFMLQGTLMPVIGYPILIAQAQEHASLFSLPSHDQPWSNTTALISLGSFMLDALGTITWMMGMFFEVVGDWQLAAFRSNPNNKGKVLDQGVWRYTRHANYFGDSAQWWGVFLFAAGASFSAAANNNNNNHSDNEKSPLISPRTTFGQLTDTQDPSNDPYHRYHDIVHDDNGYHSFQDDIPSDASGYQTHGEAPVNEQHVHSSSSTNSINF
eukprot:gb/GECH01004055.1/.p1 GENE.gb/GECH01004055.1/~~gb/GECH01004055.1/.p1  ORF type:complete len:320 (+),score=43.05 gb/GECH01004055.1/:1-960(+)